jgi:hypothetical protein
MMNFIQEGGTGVVDGGGHRTVGEAFITISSLFAGMLWIVGSAIILATSLATISSYATSARAVAALSTHS